MTDKIKNDDKKFYLKKRGGFVIKHSNLKVALKKLSKEEFYDLFCLIDEYQTNGKLETQISNQKIDLIFEVFLNQFEIDIENYIEMCLRNKKIAENKKNS